MEGEETAHKLSNGTSLNDLEFFAKLTPNVTEIVEIAQAAYEGEDQRRYSKRV